jgi:hypothetical protein
MPIYEKGCLCANGCQVGVERADTGNVSRLKLTNRLPHLGCSAFRFCYLADPNRRVIPRTA